METEPQSSTGEPSPEWQPLNSRQRRIVGVLIEKAKTTPDAYPMTLNSLTTGCNQKSNRSPQMNLRPDEVEAIVDELREMGAAVEVQTSGRVPKYRHRMYEWLGVDKYELAVVAELLLRGEQTVGELRSRASRMEAISGLEQLRPILQSLIAKRLVLALTPEGRGQVISHGLYKERELEPLKAKFAGVPMVESHSPTPSTADTPANVPSGELDQLREEVDRLRGELADLRGEVEQLKQLFG